jgi:heme-degrading monooxygenase HmoA
MDAHKWASGRWQVMPGREQEFIERWTAWLTWTRDNVAGFRSATLLRSEDDPDRFTSISDWDTNAAANAWKLTPGFTEHLGPVRAPCTEFIGGDFDLVAHVASGGSTR